MATGWRVTSPPSPRSPGSTFPKAKPSQGLWAVLRQGVLRAALFPLYARWWRRHVGGRLFLTLLAAYLVYAGAVLLHCAADTAATATVYVGNLMQSRNRVPTVCLLSIYIFS